MLSWWIVDRRRCALLSRLANVVVGVVGVLFFCVFFFAEVFFFGPTGFAAAAPREPQGKNWPFFFKIIVETFFAKIERLLLSTISTIANDIDHLRRGGCFFFSVLFGTRK